MRTDRNQALEHDFEVIDAAIAGTSNAEPDDAALTSFVLALKSARPEPEAGFSVELDERIERLRREPENRRAENSRWQRWRPQIIAIGCVAVLAGASVAIVGQQSAGTDDVATSIAPQQAADDSVTKMAPEAAMGESTVESPQANVESLKAPRQVVRTASLRLGTGTDDFNDTTDEVIAITDRAGGFVSESSIADGTAGEPSGNLALLIPAAEFQKTLASLSELGTVLDRQQDTTDVTASVSRIDRSLSRARASRASVRRQLSQATTDEQRAVLRAKLRRANARVARVVVERRSLQRQIRFVPLSVTVEASAARDNTSTIDEALDTAKSALEMIAAVLIVALAIAVPLGLFVLAIVVVTTWWRRRTRTRAIDSAADSEPQAT